MGKSGLPFAALGSKTFDVRFAEILLGPVGGALDVVAEETRIVRRRESLVGKQRKLVVGGSPLVAALLAMQALNSSPPCIELQHEVGGLDCLINWVRDAVSKLGLP